LKKQKKLLIFILILLIIAGILFFIFRTPKKDNYSEISIIFSDFSVSPEDKNIKITDKNAIKEINNMCKNFESGKHDDVSTTIINNYVVTLGNGNTIYMDSTVSNYGYVKYANSEELEFIRLPDGFHSYIKELVNSNLNQN